MTKAFADYAGDQLPASWEALMKDEFFIPCALKSKIVSYQRKAFSAFSFGGVAWVFVEYGKM